jgi:hypothetical protein
MDEDDEDDATRGVAALLEPNSSSPNILQTEENDETKIAINK